MKKLVFMSLLSALTLGLGQSAFADFGDVLFPTAVGAGIGGAIGGGRGAGIGAAVGFGAGALSSSARDRDGYYYDDYGYGYSRPVKYRRSSYRQPTYYESDDYGYSRPAKYRRSTYYRQPMYYESDNSDVYSEPFYRD